MCQISKYISKQKKTKLILFLTKYPRRFLTNIFLIIIKNLKPRILCHFEKAIFGPF